MPVLKDVVQQTLVTKLDWCGRKNVMPYELYHYCSNIKCFSILGNKNIRLSDIQKSNDYRELSLFFPAILDCLDNLYYQSPFEFKYAKRKKSSAFRKLLDGSYEFWRKQFETGGFSNFVLCFSETPDVLSQWRGYADNGKGCCIGFRHEDIANYCSNTNNVLRLEKVEYLSESDIAQTIKDTAQNILEDLYGLRSWIVENMTHDDDDPDTDRLLRFNFDGMLEAAFIDSLKYKSYSFHEENEWRLFFVKPAYKNPRWIATNDVEDFMGPEDFAETIQFLKNKIQFLTTEDDLIPFCPIKFEEFSCNPVSSIWLGPKNKIRSSDLELFLQSNRYTETRIKKSQITYC